jgi:cellulose synthase/poly-beta-1,6-N-acetylglucosamine synthase-like glycosyltransferase
MLYLFWISVGLIAYAYFGYPLALWVLSRFRTHVVSRANICPSVTLIIAAHNEESRIRQKLENTIALTYPREKLQIIVASDASSDRTDEIVREYSDRGIELVRAAERRGKENAQKAALEHAVGKIAVFSDTATILDSDAIENIVANFADPSVGCVSSEDRILSEDGFQSGEGSYVRYEMFLRRLESRVNTVVGLSGSFFAARREICRDWDIDLPSDFNTLINAVRAGYRGISDPESIGYYSNVKSNSMEFKRKVRTVLRGITAFMSKIGSVNPLTCKLFLVQIVSHKLLRWLVPFLLISALISNSALALDSAFYGLLLIPHVAFYLAGLTGVCSEYFRRHFWIRMPCFFLTVNASILVAWVKYFLGMRVLAWKPSTR